MIKGDLAEEVGEESLFHDGRIEFVVIGRPTARARGIDLDWTRYSLVTIGYGLTSPVLHRVTEDHYLGMKLAFESCLRSGYRRIGLALVRQHNAMRRERWMGAYLLEQHQHLTPSERLPMFAATTDTPIAEASSWLKHSKPDVILADDPTAWRTVGVPTLGFALSAAYNYPGVHENNRGIGRHAADLMVSLLLRNERGLPAGRQTVLVEPLLEEV